jgi:hypothetical protein
MHSQPPDENDMVEMPRPTAAPLVLSVGLLVLAVGAVASVAFMVVGGGLFLIGLGIWMSQLLPGRGHVHEPLRHCEPLSFQAYREKSSNFAPACLVIACGCRSESILSPPE